MALLENVQQLEFDDLEFGTVLGRGTFGVVSKGRLKSSGQVVAIKKLFSLLNPREVSCWLGRLISFAMDYFSFSIYRC